MSWGNWHHESGMKTQMVQLSMKCSHCVISFAQWSLYVDWYQTCPLNKQSNYADPWQGPDLIVPDQGLKFWHLDDT